MMFETLSRFVACIILTQCVAACWGTSTASIGGTVSGLGDGLSLTLQDNGSDSLTVTDNGAFRFANSIPNDRTYNVVVLTQPAGQVCTVANGSGTVNSSSGSVRGILIHCGANASVGGTVSGLAPGTSLILSDGVVLLPIAANGAFAFPGTVLAGLPYQVTVATQPEGEPCMVSNETGAVVSNLMSDVTVRCNRPINLRDEDSVPRPIGDDPLLVHDPWRTRRSMRRRASPAACVEVPPTAADILLQCG